MAASYFTGCESPGTSLLSANGFPSMSCLPAQTVRYPRSRGFQSTLNPNAPLFKYDRTVFGDPYPVPITFPALPADSIACPTPGQVVDATAIKPFKSGFAVIRSVAIWNAR